MPSLAAHKLTHILFALILLCAQWAVLSHQMEFDAHEDHADHIACDVCIQGSSLTSAALATNSVQVVQTPVFLTLITDESVIIPVTEFTFAQPRAPPGFSYS